MKEKSSRVPIGKAWNSTLNIYKPDKKKPVKQPIKKFYKIRPASKKRAKENKTYSTQARPEYLAEHPTCEIQVAGCTYEATEVHHKKGRIGKLLTDKTYFCAACHNCHVWAELNPIEAKEKGVSLKRK